MSILVNADPGIDDLETDLNFLLCLRRHPVGTDEDFAVPGEFNRVAAQVEEDLANARLIPEQRVGNVGIDESAEPNAFSSGIGS